jgi:VWFA-related protein
VILLDAINNYWDDLTSARARLLVTLGKLTRSERIAVYMATTQPAGITVIQDFTTDRELLTRGLEKFRTPAIKPVPGPTRQPPTPPAEEEARRNNAVLDTMSAFRMLSEHLGKLPGRKSLLWVTSGLPPKQVRETPEPYDRAAAALNDADIAVNVMDDDGVGDLHRRWGRESFWAVRQLADRTGGKTWEGRNDLENMLVEAIEEPRITYTLGFYLPDEERDDKFHPLVVRINQPKLSLRYRKGYYAGSAAPKKREALENALLDPRDSDEIPITAELHSVPNAMLRITLRVGLPQLSLHAAADQWSTTVEVMFLETNAAGHIVAKVAGGKVIQMSQSQRERFERDGIPLAHELQVAEGATQVVILLRDAESGRIGRLSVPLRAVP